MPIPTITMSAGSNVPSTSRTPVARPSAPSIAIDRDAQPDVDPVRAVFGLVEARQRLAGDARQHPVERLQHDDPACPAWPAPRPPPARYSRRRSPPRAPPAAARRSSDRHPRGCGPNGRRPDRAPHSPAAAPHHRSPRSACHSRSIRRRRSSPGTPSGSTARTVRPSIMSIRRSSQNAGGRISNRSNALSPAR